jgi:hypothetical protein
LDNQLPPDPASRRRWLLLKALETAPLKEALAMAQGAESFVSGVAAGNAKRAVFEVTNEAPTLEAAPAVERPEWQPPSASMITNARPMVGAEAFAGLSSLASIEDVMAYLERDGEVFATDENTNELLVRANLKRIKAGLPPFTLLPGAPTKTATQDKSPRIEKVTPPRPLTKQQRAEWARQVVALSAD